MSLELLNKWRGMDLKDTFLKNELEKKDSALLPFFTDKISYGVDGIKSKLGAGTSQINEFTIAASISAYAKFILKTGIKKEIVIGHDNRKNSKLFAEVAASVLMSNGIKAYLYEENELQPAPVISYTIRKKKLGGGINITASCDSKDFNGIKIYNQFGGQLVFDDIKLIQSFMKDIDPLLVDRSQDIPPVIQKSIIEKYIDDVKSIELNKGDKTNIKVAYSAQHGAGAVIVPKVLKNLGVDISIVEKQNNPDPDFKNTKSPNPADGKSFRKVESLARKTKADLFFVTDPTVSHLGVAVKYKRRYKYLSGNQMSTIYLDYRLSQLKKNGMIPKDSYIVTTIASSHLPEKIAKKYGVRTLKTHVGFQNIADIVENSKGAFLFAFEESQGCLIDANISREGDAIQTAVGIVDMISYYKTQGINPFEKLKDIYENYNIHRTTNFTRNITTKRLRSLKKAIKKTKYIGELKVKKIVDYSKTNEFGKSDVMEMIFENESRIIFKPSENKEKIKVYVEAVSSKKQNLEDIVWFEKEVNIFVGNNTDDVKEPTLSWKGAIKYLIFIW